LEMTWSCLAAPLLAAQVPHSFPWGLKVAGGQRSGCHVHLTACHQGARFQKGLLVGPPVSSQQIQQWLSERTRCAPLQSGLVACQQGECRCGWHPKSLDVSGEAMYSAQQPRPAGLQGLTHDTQSQPDRSQS
jgi:hypothetical protein